MAAVIMHPFQFQQTLPTVEPLHSKGQKQHPSVKNGAHTFTEKAQKERAAICVDVRHDLRGERVQKKRVRNEQVTARKRLENLSTQLALFAGQFLAELPDRREPFHIRTASLLSEAIDMIGQRAVEPARLQQAAQHIQTGMRVLIQNLKKSLVSINQAKARAAIEKGAKEYFKQGVQALQARGEAFVAANSDGYKVRYLQLLSAAFALCDQQGPQAAALALKTQLTELNNFVAQAK